MANLKKAELAIVTAYREAFKEAKGRDIKLSNEVLHGVIERGGSTFEDMEEEDQIAFLISAEDTANKVAASDIDVGISVLARKLDEDTHAVTTMRNNVEAVMAGKINAVTMYAEFKRIYSAEELNSMPYPGTEKDSPYLGNFKPDIVKTIAKTGSNAGQEITVTWSNDFVSALGIGKQYETIIANCEKELANGGSIPAYKGWGKADLDAEKADATARRNAVRSMVKRAIELHHMFEGVRGMEKVNLRWCKAKGDNAKFFAMPEKFGEEEPSIKVTRSPKNLWIFPKGEDENGRIFSVTQLLAMDVATAIKNGGTFGDLVATARKGADGEGGEGEGGAGDGVDMTEGEAYATASKTINFLNKRENNATVLRILADKNHPEHKDWVELVGDTWSSFYPLIKRCKTEYETLKETKIEGIGDDKAAA